VFQSIFFADIIPNRIYPVVIEQSYGTSPMLNGFIIYKWTMFNSYGKSEGNLGYAKFTEIELEILGYTLW
jgi:hypothetical protein